MNKCDRCLKPGATKVFMTHPSLRHALLWFCDEGCRAWWYCEYHNLPVPTSLSPVDPRLAAIEMALFFGGMDDVVVENGRIYLNSFNPPIILEVQSED